VKYVERDSGLGLGKNGTWELGELGKMGLKDWEKMGLGVKGKWDWCKR
jgi:hypothetical protein